MKTIPMMYKYNITDFILKPRTSKVYFGPLVAMKYIPHIFAKWAHSKTKNGIDVATALTGSFT